MEDPSYYPIENKGLATLGCEKSKLTVSMKVAHEHFEYSNIKGYSTYEEAAKAVKKGKQNFLLVCHKYPKFKNLLDGLTVKHSFTSSIPEFVLGRLGKLSISQKNLVCHPAALRYVDGGHAFKAHISVDDNTKTIAKAQELLAKFGGVTFVCPRYLADHFWQAYDFIYPPEMATWSLLGKTGSTS